MRPLARRLPAILIVVAALALLASACGGDDSENGDDKNGGNAAPAGDVVTTITSIATDNKFDKTAYTIPEGQEVTLTLENKGQALHNFHIKAKAKDGKEPTTQLLTANGTETIKFTIEESGTYEFLCDVHPVEMKGKVTVKS